MSAPPNVRYRFGQFDLQPDERRLLAAGVPIAIKRRAFDLLVALVERQGGLVTKEHLFEQVWPGVIVEENALHAQISALRKLLGPDAITTVSGAGYRFAIAVAPSASAAAAPRHNLVPRLTSFIGREPQIAELKDLLRQTRLLTLSGAGGCGKTRLALEVAARVSDAHADGVWMVELAALADGALVPQTVAGVLGLKEQPGQSPTQAIVTQLAGKHLLLVLDNAEHLLAACADLAQTLLGRCDHLSILVTSRERLGVSGELTYRVPSLSVPDPHRKLVAETLAAYESARLFIDRARLAHARFTVTEQNASAIASICAHLDGIPLAIELAAARVRAMSVEEVNQRLDQRFRLLTDGSRTALPRQRTLRALIDWSYDLLNDAEKAVFCRASVFAGGFTLDAAERVLSGGMVDEMTMLDLLTSLTDKSLLQAEEYDGVTRYRQLETVRQYGRGQLHESGEEHPWQQRHLAYFLALAEDAEAGLRGVEQPSWLRRLEAEHENLRAALASAPPLNDAAAGMRIASALFPFWYLRGYWIEGLSWLSRFLDAPAGQSDALRAKALNAAGALAYRHTQYPGDHRTPVSLLEESLAIRRRLGDRRGTAVTLNSLGIVLANDDDLAGARGMLEEALAITREIDDRWGIARTLLAIASVVCQQGDHALARSLAGECLAIERELGGGDLLYARLSLADIALAQGDAAGAATFCRELLIGSVDRDDGTNSHAYILETTACVESGLGQPARAAVLWGQAQRLRQELGEAFARDEHLRHERSVSSARAALADDAAFDAAWQSGYAMTTQQAIELAIHATSR